jgi:integrase/recombinase XerD
LGGETTGTRRIALTLEQVLDQPEATEVVNVVGWEIAALPDVYPHQLRHTFASNLVLGGMDAYLAMALTSTTLTCLGDT